MTLIVTVIASEVEIPGFNTGQVEISDFIILSGEKVLDNLRGMSNDILSLYIYIDSEKSPILDYLKTNPFCHIALIVQRTIYQTLLPLANSHHWELIPVGRDFDKNLIDQIIVEIGDSRESLTYQ